MIRPRTDEGGTTNRQPAAPVVNKGGVGINLRLAELDTRATTDLDAVVSRLSAEASPYKPTVLLLSHLLAQSWSTVPRSTRRGAETRTPARPGRPPP